MSLLIINQKDYNSYQFLLLNLCYVLQIQMIYRLLLYCLRLEINFGLLIIIFLIHYFILVHYQIYWYDFLLNPWYIFYQISWHLLNANFSCLVSIKYFDSLKISHLEQIQWSNLILKLNWLFIRFFFHYQKKNLFPKYQSLSPCWYLPQ